MVLPVVCWFRCLLCSSQGPRRAGPRVSGSGLSKPNSVAPPQPLERAVVDGAPGPVDVSKAGLPRAERRASEDETTMRFWPVPPVDTGAP